MTRSLYFKGCFDAHAYLMLHDLAFYDVIQYKFGVWWSIEGLTLVILHHSKKVRFPNSDLIPLLKVQLLTRGPNQNFETVPF